MVQSEFDLDDKNYYISLLHVFFDDNNKRIRYIRTMKAFSPNVQF